MLAKNNKRAQLLYIIAKLPIRGTLIMMTFLGDTNTMYDHWLSNWQRWTDHPITSLTTMYSNYLHHLQTFFGQAYICPAVPTGRRGYLGGGGVYSQTLD